MFKLRLGILAISGWLGLSGCVHFGALNNSQKAPSSGIPTRQANALSGSAFISGIMTLPQDQRERAILREMRRGNLPDFLRSLKPIQLSAKDAQGREHRGTVWVTSDYLAVGDSNDYVRMPMNPLTAQRIADLYGFSLPTKKLVDEIYKQAETKLKPENLAPSDKMVSVDYLARHNAMIEAKLVSGARGSLIVGHKKDLVLTNRLQDLRNRVAIYGWHRENGAAIQPLSLVHNNLYADYSHGVRLVHGMMQVDGDLKPVAEVLQDPNLAPLLSEEGTLRATRVATDCGGV